MNRSTKIAMIATPIASAFLAALGGFWFSHTVSNSQPLAPVPVAITSPTPVTVVTPTPVTVASPVVSPSPITTAMSQIENDYLADLKQYLQPALMQSLGDAKLIQMGHEIAIMADTANNIDELNTAFDNKYKGLISGDYGLNRAGLLKAAVIRMNISRQASLQPKTPEPEVVVQTVYEPAEPIRVDHFQDTYLIVNDPPTNVRFQPNINSSVVDVIPQPKKVIVNAYSNGWFYAPVHHGWIHESQFARN